ncbi:hypothetical protein D9M68_354590 [compost metagenome]
MPRAFSISSGSASRPMPTAHLASGLWVPGLARREGFMPDMPSRSQAAIRASNTPSAGNSPSPYRTAACEQAFELVHSWNIGKVVTPPFAGHRGV